MKESMKKKTENMKTSLHATEDIAEKFLNKSVKEIIKQYPEIEKSLDEYNIGCAPCSVGTCLLKDIVEIHNLSADEEQELLARIAKVIYPNRAIKISPTKRKKRSSKEIKYSPPVKKLVDEHVLIKRWVALIPQVSNALDFSSKENKQVILDGMDFTRSYADKYHHAKEEDILFKYFDENLDILKVIREDHEKARMYVGAILDALKREDKDTVVENLSIYRELLTEHIKKEDEVLYPWLDRNLSVTQIGTLFSKFNDVDQQFGNAPEKYEKLIKSIEKKFKIKEEVIK